MNFYLGSLVIKCSECLYGEIFITLSQISAISSEIMGTRQPQLAKQIKLKIVFTMEITTSGKVLLTKAVLLNGQARLTLKLQCLIYK